MLQWSVGACGAVLLPSASIIVACGPPAASPSAPAPASVLPRVRSASWDSHAFNRARGHAGAIPSAYMASIEGPDGDHAHLGKHLPYVPTAGLTAPNGYLPLMWGDPARGDAMHPNAPRSASNPTGHWYNWIRLRAAVAGEADEVESLYSDWPSLGAGDTGKLASANGGALTDDSGKHTVYLARLPSGVVPGDWVRVHAHCLTHGEYVDFVRV